MKKLLTAFIFILTILGVKSQDSIPFLINSYEEALEQASEAYKPLLFYFHGNFCYQCTELDSVFKDDRLSRYLALNYVNVRMDNNAPLGDRLNKKFNIKSLPSLVFLNESQELMFVLEEDFNVDEILKYARWTINPASRGGEYLVALEKKKKISKFEKVDSCFEFTIRDNMVVEIENETTLYNQSQLHKVLKDGLAEEHAIKYLKTQNDWTSEKNMNFIMDFVSDTRSPAFDYLVSNRKIFNEKYGKTQVDSLISHLIYKRLYQLQPPPNYKEVKSLLRLLSPKKTDQRTYDYLIDLKLKTNKTTEYLYLERKYIKKYAPKDHERMINMIKVYLDEIPESYNADYYASLGETANKINPNNIDYLTTLCRVNIKSGDKCAALENAVRAYTLTLKEGDNPDKILELLLVIDKMHN